MDTEATERTRSTRPSRGGSIPSRFEAKVGLREKSIAIWLMICAALVFAMVVVGGLTRLTESGLSIVEWKPVSGILPPLNAEAWEEEFQKYQTSPQYLKVNKGMSVEEFKNIFWLEYVHRLLGRVIGVIFLFPCIYFFVKKSLPAHLAPRFMMIFLLGGLQGVIGWYMVTSGLTHEPMVSPLRLALHLIIAFILFALLIVSAMDVLGICFSHSENRSTLHKSSLILCAVVFVQVTLGALVAGNDAGRVYNTFPLMDGKFIPTGLWIQTPWITNFFHNITTVQFNHRIMAYLVVLSVVAFWFRFHKKLEDTRLVHFLNLILILTLIQVSVGITTLLYAVPVALASIHQALALILFGVCVIIWRGTRQPHLVSSQITKAF